MSAPGDLAELLAALAHAVPVLPGAACVGSATLFDPEDRVDENSENVRYRHDAALELCGSCPARRSCEEWVAGLTPAQRPLGIVAGRLIRKPGWRAKVAV